jgi:hypothetical protein
MSTNIQSLSRMQGTVVWRRKRFLFKLNGTFTFKSCSGTCRFRNCSSKWNHVCDSLQYFIVRHAHGPITMTNMPFSLYLEYVSFSLLLSGSLSLSLFTAPPLFMESGPDDLSKVAVWVGLFSYWWVSMAFTVPLKHINNDTYLTRIFIA